MTDYEKLKKIFKNIEWHEAVLTGLVALVMICFALAVILGVILPIIIKFPLGFITLVSVVALSSVITGMVISHRNISETDDDQHN